MRKIQFSTWKDGNNEMDTAKAIMFLVNLIPADKMPRGLENFKIMSNLSDALERAKQLSLETDSSFIFLEETEYNFVCDSVKQHIPAAWAFDRNASKVIMGLLDAEKVDIKE